MAAGACVKRLGGSSVLNARARIEIYSVILELCVDWHAFRVK